jgi:dGTPase
VQLDKGQAHTPDAQPWNVRRALQKSSDSARTSYEVDRDRILHCTTFRELQYKTQVQGLVGERKSTFFRTRLNHVIEVAQIARGLARLLSANESLSEAIALAHDLGHPPFGHAGERALRDALRRRERGGWNANVHSLEVVDRIEPTFLSFRGLNLTFAVREGIALHSTPFDEPVSFGEFAEQPNGGIECQIVDLADVFAYLAHDLDDALAGAYLSFDDLGHLKTIGELVEDAESRWDRVASGVWPATERDTLIRKRVIATLINRLIQEAGTRTRTLLAEFGMSSADAVRSCPDRVVRPAEDHEALVQGLLTILTDRYYRSADVATADETARRLVDDLLERLITSSEIIPERFRGGDVIIDAATYLASLNDFAAAELAHNLGLAAAGCRTT